MADALGKDDPSLRDQRALDSLAFFIAAMLTAFGAFFSFYLIEQGWTQAHVGVMISAGTVASAAFAMPSGMLVDALVTKRAIAAFGIVGAAGSTLLFSAWPMHWPVLTAQILFAASAGILGPVIAALSIALVGPDNLEARFGRNARYGALGTAVSAAALGFVGSAVSARAIFAASAFLSLPALVFLWRLSPGDSSPPAYNRPTKPTAQQPAWRLLKDTSLLKMVAAVFLFHLSNAAMLPVAAGEAAKALGASAGLLVAGSVLIAQLVPAFMSPWVAFRATTVGRRPLLLIGYGCLTARGAWLALAHNPYLLPIIQVFDGLSAAIMGVIIPLVVADITRSSGRFNLALAGLGLAASVGASVSTTVAGMVTEALGHTTAFACLSAIALSGGGLVWLLMPETRVEAGRSIRPC